MPTTREELQAIPRDWFQQNLDQIVSDIVRHLKLTARRQSYYEHDVLSYTNKTGVYRDFPRITLEDVVAALKRELIDCDVVVQRDQTPERTIARLVIRIDWSNNNTKDENPQK